MSELRAGLALSKSLLTWQSRGQEMWQEPTPVPSAAQQLRIPWQRVVFMDIQCCAHPGVSISISQGRLYWAFLLSFGKENGLLDLLVRVVYNLWVSQRLLHLKHQGLCFSVAWSLSKVGVKCYQATWLCLGSPNNRGDNLKYVAIKKSYLCILAMHKKCLTGIFEMWIFFPLYGWGKSQANA